MNHWMQHQDPSTKYRYRMPSTDAFSRCKRLRSVQSYVCENLSEKISLCDAAQQANLCPTYFSRYFKTHVGMQFCRWLKERRTNVAIDLLITTDRTVSEIAFRVGFGSLSTLERAIKNSTGLSPSAMRRDMAVRGSHHCPTCKRRY